MLLVWIMSLSVHVVGLSTQWASYLSFDTQRLGPNSTLANLLARRGPFSGRNATLSGIAVRPAIDWPRSFPDLGVGPLDLSGREFGGCRCSENLFQTFQT